MGCSTTRILLHAATAAGFSISPSFAADADANVLDRIAEWRIQWKNEPGWNEQNKFDALEWENIRPLDLAPRVDEYTWIRGLPPGPNSFLYPFRNELYDQFLRDGMRDFIRGPSLQK